MKRLGLLAVMAVFATNAAAQGTYDVAALNAFHAEREKILLADDGWFTVAGLHFRAAAGTKIEAKGGNTFLVDGRVRVKLTGPEAHVRESGGRQELLAPLVFQNGTARLVEELVW